MWYSRMVYIDMSSSIVDRETMLAQSLELLCPWLLAQTQIEHFVVSVYVRLIVS